MVAPSLDAAQAWKVLARIPDPEIPVITITELGIVRDVRLESGAVVVSMTPTYSGCPAMDMIERDVVARLQDAGFGDVRVRTVLSPAWTTDWIGEEARARLREYGIAPPVRRGSGVETQRIHLHARAVRCPSCGSALTERVSEFGSTACKAHYRCLECLEPFDYFKPL